MRMTDLQDKKESLRQEYLKFLEDAYNWSQSDSALSDFSEFHALQLLDELNRLEFLEREFILN
ncbi:MAG: Lacal_2735 family protein [Flavobacteriaceae bacterium]|nr:Lacal_2735 family protein [Flavobacteriaceae bacterium]